MDSPIDRKIESITQRLKILQPKAIAVFSACTVERHEDIYRAYSRNKKDSELVRNALDATWAFLTGTGNQKNILIFVADIERATPRPMEDDSAIESILAQNLCISVDVMLRCSLDGDQEPLPGDFVLAAIRAALTDAATGFYELGSGPEAEEFEFVLLRHPIIKAEFNHQIEDLETLESQEVTNDLILKLNKEWCQEASRQHRSPSRPQAGGLSLKALLV